MLLIFGGTAMNGQIDLFQWLKDREGPIIAGCGDCVCRNCLYWWSNRCPYGKCYDDKRAKDDPYDKAHPGDPPRKSWSNWRKDQAYWCRGGVCYPIFNCDHFVKYKDQEVKECLNALVSVFQDGYIGCSLVNSLGCEECYRRFEEKCRD